jgi:hypothetical protein
VSDRGETVGWSGRVSFFEDQFQDMATFPDISRTAKPSIGRQGLTGGRLRFASDGIYWEAGSLATPKSEVRGTFHLPWAIVNSIEVQNIPHKLNFLGGAIIINLRGGARPLHGEFLGSRKSLLAAIKMSPVGPSS